MNMSERSAQPVTEGLWTLMCGRMNKVLLFVNEGETWLSERNVMCEPPPSWVAPAQTLSVKSVGAFLMKTRSGRGKYALI